MGDKPDSSVGGTRSVPDVIQGGVLVPRSVAPNNASLKFEASRSGNLSESVSVSHMEADSSQLRYFEQGALSRFVKLHALPTCLLDPRGIQWLQIRGANLVSVTEGRCERKLYDRSKAIVKDCRDVHHLPTDAYRI